MTRTADANNFLTIFVLKYNLPHIQSQSTNIDHIKFLITLPHVCIIIYVDIYHEDNRSTKMVFTFNKISTVGQNFSKETSTCFFKIATNCTLKIKFGFDGELLN